MEPRRNVRIIGPTQGSQESPEEAIALIPLDATGCNENMRQIASQQLRVFFHVIDESGLQEETIYLALCERRATAISVSARIQLVLFLRQIDKDRHRLRLISRKTRLFQTFFDIVRTVASFPCHDVAIIEFRRSLDV